MIDHLRSYWKIYLLTIVTLSSIVIIFNPVAPGINLDDDVDDDIDDPSFVEEYTGLQFGIELGGGTRIQAPLHAVTAENVTLDDDADIAALEEDIADQFDDIDATDVSIRENTIEITSSEVDVTGFENALNEIEIEYERVREGATQETRDQAVNILETRIDSAGLSGGDVREVELRDSDQSTILIEVPDLDRQEAIDLVTTRGEVRIDIYYFDIDDEEYRTEEAVLTREDFRTIGGPREGDEVTGPHVPVTLESSSAETFAQQTIDKGVAQTGGSVCQYEQAPDETEPCLLTVVDDEVVYSAGMSGDLAADIQAGTWEDDPNFILQTESFSEAQDLSVNLQSGGLPTTLDIDSGEINFISPQQGEEFRMIALIIGILSILAVATTVSLRYAQAKLSLPMIVTAVSEVIVMLAVATILNYPIDIAVIAGLVAVIGTGVDDLIIIADQIIRNDQTKRQGSKIFRKRFRKSLWIIFTAAGTTILALGPLAVLELRQLQGFAIFTIIGIIVGVLITRPAYGDILRYFFSRNR